MNIKIGEYTIRDWAPSDEAALVKYADNRKIWLNLDDRFPHPYTAADAREWIGLSTREPVTNFAIATDREAIGGIGLKLLGGVFRRSAELGYWLAEPYWGKGIATAAVPVIVDFAFGKLDMVRLQALVFARNTASAHVLEKCGFKLEGRLVKGIYKDGENIDGLIYARLRDGI
ncbi:MAG: GNAT family protein [Dehalococcoidia bacterium]|jgi:RimJ/RimL family protein N-acetyltransferase